MNTNDYLKLTWSLHMNNFKDVIKDLQETECLSDVTLVCDDDTKIRAHKFVLIGSSPVLRSMLLQSSQRDTIVFMRGVGRQELEWALQFMYLGQAQVPQTHLQTFIGLAMDLKMRGIHNEEVEQNDEKTILKTVAPEVITNFDTSDMEKSLNEQQEEREVLDEREEQERKVEYSSSLESWKNSSSIETNPDYVNKYSCKLCSYQARSKQAKDLNEHIQRVHEGIRYPCDLCDYQAGRPQNLKDHKAFKHKIDPYFRCLLCNFCTNHTKTWKRHAEKKHPDCQEQEIFEVNHPFVHRYKPILCE